MPRAAFAFPKATGGNIGFLMDGEVWIKFFA
jgi:hypothetical protein